MKASELRIGNYVYFHGDVEEINMVDGDGLIGREEQPSCPIKEFEPIPLTEEWLLKFGFEERMFGWWSSVLFLRTANRNGYFYDWQKTNENAGTNIEYVHQLQNLYFALTGKELILNA